MWVQPLRWNRPCLHEMILSKKKINQWVESMSHFKKVVYLLRFCAVCTHLLLAGYLNAPADSCCCSRLFFLFLLLTLLLLWSPKFEAPPAFQLIDVFVPPLLTAASLAATTSRPRRQAVQVNHCQAAETVAFERRICSKKKTKKQPVIKWKNRVERATPSSLTGLSHLSSPLISARLLGKVDLF